MLSAAAAILSEYCFSEVPINVSISSARRLSSPSVIIFIHKIDAIKNSSKVSFCVIDQDKIVPEEYTTYFRSVIVFGNARFIEDDAEKRKAIEILGKKYAPDDTEEGLNSAIEKEWNPLCMIELAIDHMTGKEAIELVREKQK